MLVEPADSTRPETRVPRAKIILPCSMSGSVRLPSNDSDLPAPIGAFSRIVSKVPAGTFYAARIGRIFSLEVWSSGAADVDSSGLEATARKGAGSVWVPASSLGTSIWREHAEARKSVSSIPPNRRPRVGPKPYIRIMFALDFHKDEWQPEYHTLVH